MPCRCDYLEPSEREIESKRVAELLLFLENSSKDFVSGFDKKTLKSISSDPYGGLKYLDKMVAALCSICSSMTEEQRNKYIYDGRIKECRDIADWWEKHQEADRKRLIEERRKAKAKADKEKEKDQVKKILRGLSKEDQALIKKYLRKF